MAVKKLQLKLIKPSHKYINSYIATEIEFRKVDDNKKVNPQKLRKEFPKFLKKLRDYEQGINLPKTYIPSTHYWLIKGKDIVGGITIRHRLTKQLRKIGGHIGYGIRPKYRRKGYGKIMLKKALIKAKQLGLKRVMLTCNDDNIGSWKIMLANGAKLQKREKYGKKLMRYYWINVK